MHRTGVPSISVAAPAADSFRRRTCVLAVAALVLGALSCGVPANDTLPADRYELEGEVIRVDAVHRLALIRHGDIKNTAGTVWMQAMTMEFPVKKKGDLEKLKPGVHIKAALFHRPKDMDYWLGEIEVLPKP